MDGPDIEDQLVIEVIYVDQHLIELAATLRAGAWSARTTAYTVPETLHRFAIQLQAFVDSGSPTEFVAGDTNGIGLVAMRFYRVDGACHLACHTRLAAHAAGQRPEEIGLLSLEVMTEASAVDRFALQLEQMARLKKGRASLTVSKPD